MVYKLKVPYVNNLDKLDISMVFNLNDWVFEEAIEENKDENAVVYDLDYGEHLMLSLKCNREQCSFNAKIIGIYDDEKKEPKLVTDEEYSTILNRSDITDIASTKWAPVILRNFMTYLRPFDIPDYWYEPKDVCNIIEQIKKFFEEYLHISD